MKTTLFLLATIFLTTTSLMAEESACKTDGCVMNKNAQTAAVIKYINTHDDCANAVSWLQSLKKINDDQFELICGDTSDTVKIILEVKEEQDSVFVATKIN